MDVAPLTVLFVLVAAFVANVPIWMWASDDYPRMRSYAVAGLIALVPASIWAGLTGGSPSAITIATLAFLLFVVGWGWILLSFIWQVLLRSALSLGAVLLLVAAFGAYSLLGAGEALLQPGSWSSFASEYSGTLFLTMSAWYIWACRDVREVGGRESFDLGGRGAPAVDADDGGIVYGGDHEPRSGGVYDDPRVEDQRLLNDSEKLAGRLSDDVY